jgi:perosamine synthetase
MTTKRYVCNFAGLGPDWLRPVKDPGRVPNWLPRGRTTLTPFARNALYHAWKALRPRKGDTILMPAFVCDTVTIPLMQAGARLALFNVDDDVSIDWDHVERVLARPRKGRITSMLWYHFLGQSHGFDQAVAFCRERGLRLIEDCAHATFSEHCGRPVGSSGDVAVFSISKSVPAPRAAALVVNDPKLRRKQQMPLGTPSNEQVALLHERERYLHRYHLQALDTTQPVPLEDYKALAAETRRLYARMGRVHTVDDVSMTVLHNARPDAIRGARRRNCRRYFDHIGELCPFDTMTPGASPIGFPVVVDRRDVFRAKLKSEGIDALVHWPDYLLPKPVLKRFPNVVRLANRILTLPCHHDLSPDDIDYVCKMVKRHVPKKREL